MEALIQALKEVRTKIPQLAKHSLNETSTRTILVNPILQVLGWDVTDPDIVRLEYPTIDGKNVDYALKVDGKPVLLVEAKALDDPLKEKAIGQVVSYAANDGIAWCILTNGVNWQVYKSLEQCKAPEKLMFGVNIDPKATTDKELPEAAKKMWWFSLAEMKKGTLNDLGEKAFTDEKVKAALNKLMNDPPRKLLNLIREYSNGQDIQPKKIKESLIRIGKSGYVEQPKIHKGGKTKKPPLQEKRTRKRRSNRTSPKQLGEWMLVILEEWGGKAELKKVTEEIGRRHRQELTPEDFEEQKGHAGEKKYEYNCRWAATKLRKEGMLKKKSPRGYIELA